MKTIINIFVVVLLVALQFTIFPAAGLALILPPLILPVAIVWAESGRLHGSIIWGIGTLMLLSLIFGNFIMLFSATLAFGLAYFGIRQFIHIKGRPFIFIAVLVSTFVYFFIQILLQTVFMEINNWPLFFESALPAFIISIFFWTVFPLFPKMVRLFEIWEAGSKSLLR